MFPLVKDNLQSAKVLVTLRDASLYKAESVMSVLALCQRRLEAEMRLVKDAMHLSMEDDSGVLQRMQVRGPFGVCQWWLGIRWTRLSKWQTPHRDGLSRVGVAHGPHPHAGVSLESVNPVLLMTLVYPEVSYKLSLKIVVSS